MVEADIHLRLVPTSIADIYNMFELLVCCLTDIWEHPYHYTGQVCPRFWNLGHLWSENDAITSWLRLTSTTDCFPHPYKTYKMCLRYCFAVSRAHGCTLIPLYQLSWPQNSNFWVTCGVEMMPVRNICG
jgi:hypothetical protein